MADLQVEQFSEAIKDFNLPRLMKEISEHWEDPRRKQALKILNALKNSQKLYTELLKKANYFAEGWAVCKPFAVTFSFAECNIKEDDIQAFAKWIEKLTVALNKEADKTSRYHSHIHAIHYDYTPGDTKAVFQFRYHF